MRTKGASSVSVIRATRPHEAGGKKRATPPAIYPHDRLSFGKPASRGGLYDLEHLPSPSEDVLRDIFELTQAEARIAQRLAKGDSLEEIAEHLNIRMSTARTQLSSVFAKTSTCRQGKLVAILSRLAHLAEKDGV
jgi:DNA-binding CsgD family transcriptional regulator